MNMAYAQQSTIKILTTSHVLIMNLHLLSNNTELNNRQKKFGRQSLLKVVCFLKDKYCWEVGQWVMI